MNGHKHHANAPKSNGSGDLAEANAIVNGEVRRSPVAYHCVSSKSSKKSNGVSSQSKKMGPALLRAASSVESLKRLTAKLKEEDVLTRANHMSTQSKKFLLSEHKNFMVIMYVAIFSYTVILGLTVDYPDSEAIQGFEIALSSAFVIEFFIKLFELRTKVFSDYWNWIDGFLVVMTLVEYIALAAESDEAMVGLKNLRLIRCLRVLRLVRPFKEFYMIVYALARCFSALGWILCVWFIILYMIAIVCVQLVGGQPKSMYPGRLEEWENEEWKSMQEFNPVERFGTVIRSMFTLFCFVAEDTFASVGGPLMEKQPYMFILMVFLVLIMACGMMNVILGVFIQKTMDNFKAAKEMSEKQKKDRQLAEIKNFTNALKELDEDCSGRISEQEIHESLTNPEFQEIWSVLDLPQGITAKEICLLFDQYEDSDGVGELELGFADIVLGYQRLLYMDKRQQLNQLLVAGNAVRRSVNFHLERKVDFILETLQQCSMSSGDDMSARALETEEKDSKEILEKLESVSIKQAKLDARQNKIRSKIRAFASQVRAIQPVLLMGQLGQEGLITELLQ